MRYVLKVYAANEAKEKNAGGKAPKDIERILKKKGFASISVDVSHGEKGKLFKRWRIIWTKLKRLKAGDELLLQYPFDASSTIMPLIIKRLQLEGISVYLLIHDLPTLSRGKNVDIPYYIRIKTGITEKMIMTAADGIIVHSLPMKKYLIRKYGVTSVGVLKMFDYIMPEDEGAAVGREYPLVVAGNLDPQKSGYIYKLKERLNVYGAGFDDRLAGDNISYKGSFTPEELPGKLEGSFGIVWDGSSADDCRGITGRYLRYNSPHKFSLYIAAGLPVIVWDKAALAPIVKKEGLGICVSSLENIGDEVRKISQEGYSDILFSVNRFGQMMKKGHFTLRAVGKCMGDYGETEHN